MRVIKKLLLSLLLIVLALGLGGAIYIIQMKYFEEPSVTETETPSPTEAATAAPTSEPDLNQYVITIDNVNIRKEPTTDSEIIEQVPKDTVLQLLYSDSEWSSVLYNDENAYVNNEYVTAHNMNSSEQKNGTGKKIVIDAGCQGVSDEEKEPIGPDASVMKPKAEEGFTGAKSGKKEFELNLEIANKLKSALEQEGYEVVMTRESNDINMSHIERAEFVNSKGADLCISIRANASMEESDKGVVGVCPSINNPYCPEIYNSSYKLANALSNEVAMACGTLNCGLWQNDTYTFINWSEIPVTVLRVGYLSNEAEEQSLIQDDYQAKIVEGILKGLEVYFGQ